MSAKDYILTSITTYRKEPSRPGILEAGLYGALKRTTILSHAINKQLELSIFRWFHK